MKLAAWFLLLLALAPGCLRVGPGEDLHLVCEEKRDTPRIPYGPDFLYAATRFDEGLAESEKLAMADALRRHVVTMGGRPYADFSGSLAAIGNDSWRFDATGVFETLPPDVYVLIVTREAHAYRVASSPPVEPIAAPRHLSDAAWRAVNATPELTQKLGASPVVARAAWDPALPSCVSLRIASSEPDVEATVNVVQSRVVHIGTAT